MDSQPILPPVQPDKRIVSLDVLRGFAVLGILIMNIQSYSMVEAAYINPTAYGDLTGLNKWVWIFSHVIADQKFITIFSMLFGAGVILFTERLEHKGVKPLGLYFKRLFWLWIFGLIHAYLFWHGDILVIYAICGVLVYWVRKWKVQGLITLGLILFFVPAFNYWLFGASMEYWPPDSLEGLKHAWKPDDSTMANEIDMLRGNPMMQLQWRAPAALKMETFVFLIFLGWRVAGMMMIGMALYKSGVLIGQKSISFYTMLMVLCFALGLFLVITGVIKNFEADWSVQYSMFHGSLWNYIGSFFIALAYVSKIMMGMKIPFLKGILNRMAEVGRMAFSNYILMTLSCTFIFYGHGFGMFGSIERSGQVMIVFAVWIVVLLFSILWLKYFKYGPLEWLWRYLTYGSNIPLKYSSIEVKK